MEPLLNIAISAAKQAGDIILRYAEQTDRLKITPKNAKEYFTEVDIKAEQAIIQTIHEAYPKHGILAEESGLHQDDSETVWIVDPLDGTTNYIHGFPFYSVSIAVKVKNRIEHAVVYDPIHHEYFTASRGRGARLNDKRIRVSKQTLLANSLVGTGFPFRDLSLTERYFSTFQNLFGKCAGIRRTGSAALDLAYVAAGRLDGYWEFGLRPWDIAAGILLIQEAGGLTGDIQGGENYFKTGDVVAGTPKVFKALLQTLGSK